MIPEQENDPEAELSPQSATILRTAANVLGVIAGILFLIAFALSLSRQDEPNLYFLGMGVLFLCFPLLMNKLVRPTR